MRRIGRDDLRSTNPFSEEEGLGPPYHYWGVYERYERVEQGEDHLPYFEARGRMVRGHDPLFDTPYLCLEFARIAEREDLTGALEQWIGQYGLLGLAYERVPFPDFSDNPHVETYAPSTEYMPDVVFPPGRYLDTGGPGETLAALREEAYVANEVLALYEAALNGDKARLEEVLFPTQKDPERLELRRLMVQKTQERPGVSRTDALIDEALRRASSLIQERLGLFASPAIYTPEDTEGFQQFLTIDRLTTGWHPRNLLGAIYLQFYSLVTSGRDLSRCRYCGRIISYAAPMPTGEVGKGRKPRQDKVFCSRQCRQNHHYHTRVKPRRQEGRT